MSSTGSSRDSSSGDSVKPKRASMSVDSGTRVAAAETASLWPPDTQLGTRAFSDPVPSASSAGNPAPGSGAAINRVIWDLHQRHGSDLGSSVTSSIHTISSPDSMHRQIWGRETDSGASFASEGGGTNTDIWAPSSAFFTSESHDSGAGKSALARH